MIAGDIGRLENKIRKKPNVHTTGAPGQERAANGKLISSPKLAKCYNICK